MLGRGEGDRAGVHAERGLEVVGVIVAHRTDEAQVVGTFGDVRKKLADPQARLAALLEFPLRPLEIFLDHAVVRREGLQHLLRHLEGLVVVGDQFRLVVERIDVRHAAAHVQEDDPLGTRTEMGVLAPSGSRRSVLTAVACQQFGKDARQ